MLPACPPLEVPNEIMASIIQVESARNPFAIGVVGDRLVRQPANLKEAIATAELLEKEGMNFSVGLAQVNRYNLKKYGLNTYEVAFDVCSNLVAGSKILNECYSRSGADWGKAFSCYYSGNFVVGFKHGYVQKVSLVLDRYLQAKAKSEAKNSDTAAKAVAENAGSTSGVILASLVKNAENLTTVSKDNSIKNISFKDVPTTSKECSRFKPCFRGNNILNSKSEGDSAFIF